MNGASIASRGCGAALCVALIGGCADLTVKQVTDGDKTTKGLRYYLPKPYLMAAPQADGTVNFDVVFLPDKSRSYAVDTSSYLSSYTFQATRDEKGMLTALEFKASTAAVGQQLASSIASYATQAYNIKAASAVAQQTQVNTAQTALDTARANRAAAEATLASDKANGAKPEAITADYAAAASAKAKEEIAEQALQRAQTTAQVVSTTVAAGAPATTTTPAMGTAFAQPTWNPPTTVNLPQQYGPVLYAINDSGAAVQVVAVQSMLNGAVLSTNAQSGVIAAAQPTFKTTSMALGPPLLFPQSQSQPKAAKQATFIFDRPIKSMTAAGSSVVTDATPPKPMTSAPKLGADNKTVTVDTTGFEAGSYIVTVAYSYVIDPTGASMSVTKQVKLSVTP